MEDRVLEVHHLTAIIETTRIMVDRVREVHHLIAIITEPATITTMGITKPTTRLTEEVPEITTVEVIVVAEAKAHSPIARYAAPNDRLGISLFSITVVGA